MSSRRFERHPQIRWHALPSAEQEAGRLIDSLLSGLRTLVQRFANALSLMDFCERETAAAAQQKKIRDRQQAPQSGDAVRASIEMFLDTARPLADWKRFAVRDTIITIWDFAETLQALRAAVGRSPTVREFAHAALGNVIREFHAQFPDAELMRHGVCHSIHSSTWPEKHAYTGDVVIPGFDMTRATRVVIQEVLTDRILTVTRDHKIMQRTLDAGTLQKLSQIQQSTYAALRPAADHTEKLFREEINRRMGAPASKTKAP
jgi:hypothetical protein